ncbi:toxin-antitoxin system HicB family antitoxin [Mycobacterium hackensackense]|uniref:type II toxin-antitoxin system HicB family antitoxin n=1 Tax=Mycobacterium hackensackense TaxID=228909 RepID=UPI0027E36AD2|nr:toxin-antitoxin system HicB family antitoxin [Mycobacterium hackensackense]MCV7255324.1 toxin-antitoxin system HicB family antitoxin [Mycobacterium hackensackense]
MSNHYTYRAEWSPEDGEYVGLVAEFPSLSWLAATAAEAVAGASELVDGILADMDESGETPPEPFTERRYSGNLSFRTSPAQHRALAIEAAEQNVSVNQLLVYKSAVRAQLAERTKEAIAHLPSADWLSDLSSKISGQFEPDVVAKSHMIVVVNPTGGDLHNVRIDPGAVALDGDGFASYTIDGDLHSRS